MVNSLEFMSIVALQLIYQKILIKLFRKSIPEQVVFDESFIVFSTSADDRGELDVQGLFGYSTEATFSFAVQKEIFCNTVA